MTEKQWLKMVDEGDVDGLEEAKTSRKRKARSVSVVSRSFMYGHIRMPQLQYSVTYAGVCTVWCSYTCILVCHSTAAV